jgi:gluconokinase
LARALAEALSLPFIDADDLHSQTNKDKMSMGEPLTDADRMPWLMRVRKTAVEAMESDGRGGVSGILVACSALKASYREVLRDKHADLASSGDGAPCWGAEADKSEKGDGDIRLPVKDGSKGKQASNITAAWKARPPPRTYFVHPFGARSILWERMTNRESHFMKANMLASQLDTLENPAEIGEEGIVEIGLDASPEEQARVAIEGLRSAGAIPMC